MVKRCLAKPELSALLMLALLCTVFQAANPAFLSWANIATMLRAMAFPGLIALGMTLCLMAGAIDLSAGAVAGFSASLAAYLMMRQGWSIWSAVAATLVISSLIGLLNCFVIFRLKVMAFISTIGMMYVLKSLGMWVTNGMSIYPIPEVLVNFGKAQPLGVSWAFWILFAGILLVEIALRTTVWGLEVRATGSDRTIARDTEVRVDRVNYSTFLILGILSGLAGILAMCRISAGNPTIGIGWEFQAILACALGGVSLYGYSGSPVGILLGLLLMQVILTGLVEAGASPYLEGAFLGGLLILSLIVDVRKRSILKQEE